ncbi:MAG: 2-C-methyl-D-erythritol 2,4-cyclodiphosphate synthase [Bacteroidota bacterium]|nr:MAG: 2-C-methyl-D-erythritol 2,4-cyclodiphosphate synthase [Bacteroidota bacterium]
MKMRVGFGFDVHQLELGRKFVLGGVPVQHEKGCVAHSDGDVLIHAICDALLGAASLGDIGVHFPDTSKEFKDVDSKQLLKSTLGLIQEVGYHIGNIDSTICLQRPKVKEYIPEMRQTLANVLNMIPEDIGIKATTTEKLGYVGREEGISAYAVVLLYKE